jgi:hypothetical protein
MDNMQCFFKHTNSDFVLILLFIADSKLTPSPHRGTSPRSARVESLFFVRRRFDQGSVTCASGCTNPVLNIFTVSAQSNSRYYMAEIQTEMVENVVVYITK